MGTRLWLTNSYRLTTRGMDFSIPLQKLPTFTLMLIMRTLAESDLRLKLPKTFWAFHVVSVFPLSKTLRYLLSRSANADLGFI
jgi:hypothetical protein